MSEDKKTETGPSTATMEEAHELGFLGTVADPTPNEDYQLGGRLAQPPENTSADTPEDVKSQLKGDEQQSAPSSHEAAKSSKSSRS